MRPTGTVTFSLTVAAPAPTPDIVATNGAYSVPRISKRETNLFKTLRPTHELGAPVSRRSPKRSVTFSANPSARIARYAWFWFSSPRYIWVGSASISK